MRHDETAWRAINWLRSGDPTSCEASLADDQRPAVAFNLSILDALVGTTSAALASDLRIAIDLAAVGARAAQENVRINLPSVASDADRTAISARTEAMLARIEAASTSLSARV